MGSAKLAAMPTAVKFLRDQALVPPQEGIGRSDGGDFFQAFAADQVGQGRQTAACSVGQAKPPVAEFSFERASIIASATLESALRTSRRGRQID